MCNVCWRSSSLGSRDELGVSAVSGSFLLSILGSLRELSPRIQFICGVIQALCGHYVFRVLASLSSPLELVARQLGVTGLEPYRILVVGSCSLGQTRLCSTQCPTPMTHEWHIEWMYAHLRSRGKKKKDHRMNAHVLNKILTFDRRDAAVWR